MTTGGSGSASNNTAGSAAENTHLYYSAPAGDGGNGGNATVGSSGTRSYYHDGTYGLSLGFLASSGERLRR